MFNCLLNPSLLFYQTEILPVYHKTFQNLCIYPNDSKYQSCLAVSSSFRIVHLQNVFPGNLPTAKWTTFTFIILHDIFKYRLLGPLFPYFWPLSAGLNNTYHVLEFLYASALRNEPNTEKGLISINILSVPNIRRYVF